MAVKNFWRETGIDLEMKVGRCRLKLTHNVVMWTYVKQGVSFSELLDISRSGVPKG